MSEEPVYGVWNGDGIPPIHIRYGQEPWKTSVKIGNEWLPAKSVTVDWDAKELSVVTIKLYGRHLSFELVE